MTRYKAASIHFLISLLVIGSFLAFAYFIWYGRIYLDISGVMVPAKILIAVDIILGPLFTLLIFKHGKKHLKLDLMVIALVQLAAFIYGAYTLYLGKPAMVVLKGDAFEIVIQKSIAPELNKEIKTRLGLLASPQYVAIDPNKAIKQQSALVQQSFIIPIEFKQDWVKSNHVSVARVAQHLGINEAEVKNKVGTDDLSGYTFYLMHDTLSKASMVLQNNKPFKIIYTIY